MPAADYGQYCAIARGLEIVGDRWTLLVVRELLTGTRRFSHLRAGLPGVPTNLLVERLQRLERAGVITRTRTETDARGVRYELTPFGHELEDVILPLARWGSSLLDAPAPDDVYHLRWFILTMRAQFNPAAATGPPCVYEFRVDGEVIHATVAGGQLDAREGPAPAPDIVLIADRQTFLGWRTGQLSGQEAIAGGLAVDGGAPQLEQLEDLFGPTARR